MRKEGVGVGREEERGGWRRKEREGEEGGGWRGRGRKERGEKGGIKREERRERRKERREKDGIKREDRREGKKGKREGRRETEKGRGEVGPCHVMRSAEAACSALSITLLLLQT